MRQQTFGRFVISTFALTLSAILFCPAGLQTDAKQATASQNRTSVEQTDEMVLISGATFRMGTNAADIQHLQQVFGVNHAEVFEAEVPQHTVTLNDYYLDKHEITNAQFKKFLDKNPQWRKDRIASRYHNGNYLKHWNGDDYPREQANYPVVNVSWYAAVAYCQWMKKRLPTEAEWEYAARGGLKGKTFPWGDEPADPTRANYSQSKIGGVVAVGSYPPNGYGLFDMSGNVWEFMADEWAAYSSTPQFNPVAGGNLFLDNSFYAITTRRVIRGGSWGGSPINLRVTYRDSHPPDGARDFVGFRCAKPASSKR